MNIPYTYPMNLVFMITDWLVFICLVAAVYVMITENATAEAERKALVIREEAARSAYAALEENTRRSGEFRHEIKNSITAMSALAHRGEYDKLMAYIDKLDGEAVLIHGASYSENFLINSILQKYSEKASEVGVRFDAVAVVPSVIGISDEELCSFLMNMLDNALEVAAEVPRANKPFIVVKLRMTGGFLSVVCKNSYSVAPVAGEDGEYHTSKDDSLSHGFGLKQMRRVAERYGSTLVLENANGYFTVKTALTPIEEKNNITAINARLCLFITRKGVKKMKKKTLIAALVIAALTLSACGKPAETTTAATTTAVTAAAAETTAAAKTTAAAAELSDDDCRAELAPLLAGLNEVDRLAASAISCDYETKVTGENEGEEYVKVTDERFKSLADIDAFLDKYITANMKQNQYVYILDDNGGTYIERDGVLYAFNGGRGCGFSWTSKPAEISAKTDTSFTAVQEYDLFGENAYITLGIVKTDDGWRIDTFEYVD